VIEEIAGSEMSLQATSPPYAHDHADDALIFKLEVACANGAALR